MLRHSLTRAARSVCTSSASSLRSPVARTSAFISQHQGAVSSHSGLRALHTSSPLRFSNSTPSSNATTTTTATNNTTTALPKVEISNNSTSNIQISAPKDSKYYRSNHPTTTLSPIWLRDNCPCPECIHPSNTQKLHASSQIPLDIAPSAHRILPEGLELTWSKGLEDVGDWEDPAKGQPGHVSLFPWEMILGSYGGSPTEHRTSVRMNHQPVVWDKEMMGKEELWLDYEEYMNTEQGLYKALRHLHDYGLIFLRGVPTQPDDTVATVAERIGHLRHTFYGRTWDVKSLPDSVNIAYTNLNLGLHMDILYLEAPPGLQFLHSIENNVPGGTSVFMDSFKAVELIKKEHPEDYEVLRTIPNTFHYKREDHHLHFNRPTIAVDPLNDSLIVNYSPPFQGPLEVAPDQVPAFYRALKRFAEYIERPDLQHRHTLRQGECVVFHNRRVLHSRTAFDPSKGNRHLKGCYIDLDMFRDKYRITTAAKLNGKF